MTNNNFRAGDGEQLSLTLLQRADVGDQIPTMIPRMENNLGFGIRQVQDLKFSGFDIGTLNTTHTLLLFP